MRDAIDCIAKFATCSTSRVYELNGAGNVDGTIVVGALRVRPSSTGCKVPAEGTELIERPSPSNWCLRELR